MPKKHLYEIEFFGKEDLWHGNTPSYLDVPDWPRGQKTFSEEDCSELSGELFSMLTSNPHFAEAVASLDIAAAQFRILEAALNPQERRDDYGYDDEDDDEDEDPVVDCHHNIRFLIETEKPLSDAAIQWICHQIGDFIYPDGGWEIEPEEVEFEILSHAQDPKPPKAKI